MSTKLKVKRMRAAERRRMVRKRQKERRIVLGSLAVLVIVGWVVAVTRERSESPVALPQGVEKSQEGRVEIGQTFPDFEVTEVGGSSVTRDSLTPKPAIIWFTTSYCVPCQIGAKEVATLDDELGGKAFDALVVFVDPSDPPGALRDWRNKFARPDWMVALDKDGSLSKMVGLKFLDSKYLLDGSGVIGNIDFAQVNPRYLEVLRQAVRPS